MYFGKKPLILKENYIRNNFEYDFSLQKSLPTFQTLDINNTSEIIQPQNDQVHVFQRWYFSICFKNNKYLKLKSVSAVAFDNSISFDKFICLLNYLTKSVSPFALLNLQKPKLKYPNWINKQKVDLEKKQMTQPKKLLQFDD